MLAAVAPTAVVHPTAVLEHDVRVEDYARIEAGAHLGAGTQVGHGVRVGPGVRLGRNNRLLDGVILKGKTRLGDGNVIHERAVVGGQPLIAGTSPEIGSLSIGSGNVIREMTTIQVGSSEDAETRIGDGNFFMPHCQVGHDCVVGHAVTCTNYTGLCGHVVVQDLATLGMGVIIHQHTRIGRLAMVGASGYLSQDVPPFTLVDGRSGDLVGLNRVGLQRAGFTGEDTRILKAAYRTLLREETPRKQVRDQLGPLAENPLVLELLEFIESSARGVARDRRRQQAAKREAGQTQLRVYRPRAA